MKQSMLAATIAAFTLAGASGALAQPAASPARGASQPVVEAVQMPAWIERDGGSRIPLIPGMFLREHDRLRTGGNSRLLLRTPDGSMVKLGENASLTIERSQVSRERVSRRGGRWKIIAASADTQEAALKVYDAFRDAGYAAEIRPAQEGGKPVYTVRLPNFVSQADAQALVSNLKQQGPLREYDYKVSM